MRRRQCGFSLIEVLATTVGAAVCLLGHAASVVHHQRVAAELDERGIALVTLQRFAERLRADTDWDGLYGRLRPLSAESTSDNSLSSVGADLSLTMQAPTTYYSDFEVPARLGTVEVLVQVPQEGNALRENMSAPRYGLPTDLNGDGALDGNARDTDRSVLPVVIHLRWTRSGRAAQEVVLPVTLRRRS
jgi:hypothetical protein